MRGKGSWEGAGGEGSWMEEDESWKGGELKGRVRELEGKMWGLGCWKGVEGSWMGGKES